MHDNDYELNEELDENVDDFELDEDDFQEPKKKGRPKSEHYVKESDLRDEILISKQQADNVLKAIKDKYNDLIASEKNKEKKKELEVLLNDEIEKAMTKTYCTPRLGEIIVLTVERVATQSKFRQYTYLDDMKAEAIYQSIRGVNKFDLTKVNDAGQKSSSFSYLTQIITNAFRQILKKEKKNRAIKDQAIEIALNEHSDVEVDFESIKRKKEKLEASLNSQN